LTIILRLALINRQHLARIPLRLRHIHILRMPHEVLEQLVRVLLLDHQPRRLDDVARILDELAAVRGELVGVDGGGGLDVAQGLVYLFVVGHAALAEGFDHAVETDLDAGVSISMQRTRGGRRTLRSTSASLSAFITGSTTEPYCIYISTRLTGNLIGRTDLGWLLISLGAAGNDMVWNNSREVGSFSSVVI
jgi:hypothetical protein